LLEKAPNLNHNLSLQRRHRWASTPLLNRGLSTAFIGFLFETYQPPIHRTVLEDQERRDYLYRLKFQPLRGLSISTSSAFILAALKFVCDSLISSLEFLTSIICQLSRDINTLNLSRVIGPYLCQLVNSLSSTFLNPDNTFREKLTYNLY